MTEASTRSPDLVVVGAGVMGAWTALLASRSGRRTVLVDSLGPGDPRATSGDESRIIRSSHGTDSFYASWARKAREAWISLGDERGEPIFEQSGVAWFARRADGFEASSEAVLRSLGVPFEHLSPGEAATRWRGLSADGLAFVLHEPEAGALRARKGVVAAVAAFEASGGALQIDRVAPGHAIGRHLEDVVTRDGSRVHAGAFVFAAGPWLRTLFPELLGELISVTKQDVLYFGPEPGDRRFESARFPAFVEFDAAIYGIPALDRRGFKAAPDAYGRPFDPDTEDRLIDPASVATTRAFLAERIPDLATRPLVETRVCQYESTPDTHFVIDRHPAWDNVWIVGGGSGHGFKHGPEIGRYVVQRLDAGDSDGVADGPPDDRFSLGRLRVPGPTMRSGAKPLQPTHR
jgi:sarcosine oxidase